MSEIALRLRLAVWMMSSCRAEFPAATALAVAIVMPLVMRMNSSGVFVLLGESLDWNSWGRQSGWLSFGRRHTNLGKLGNQTTNLQYNKTECLLCYFFYDQPEHYSFIVIQHQSFVTLGDTDAALLLSDIHLCWRPATVLTDISCLMHSIVASSALVPRVASSSTALTVFSRDVTLVTITWQRNKMENISSISFQDFRAM